MGKRRRRGGRAHGSDLLRMIETRECRRCDGRWPVGCFERIPSGRRRTCNRCNGARRRARDRAAGRSRSARDPATERERLRDLQRKPAQRRRKRRWRQENGVQVNRRNREWRARNRERARAWGRRNARHRRLGRDPELCAWSDVLVADPCAYCGAASDGVDHIDPIARGGANDASNLAGACADCNRRKRDRPLLVFMLAEVA